MSSEYSTFRGNAARRPVTPCHLAPPLRQQWYEARSFPAPHPIIGHGLVFLASQDGRTVARDETSGSAAWVSKNMGAPGTLHGEAVVRATGRIELADARTGRTVDAIDARTPLEMACVGDVVLARTYDAQAALLYAVDLARRQITWRFRLPADNVGHSWRARISTSCGATSERVIFGTNDGTVLSLDLRTGSEFWRTTVADLSWEHHNGRRPGEPRGAVVIYDDLAIVEVLGGHVACFRSATGERRWTWYEGPSLGEGYLYGDLYYVHNGGGWVFAVDPRTGKTVSKTDLYARMPAKARVVIGDINPPFVVSETHFFTGSSSGHIVAFDRGMGRYVWSGRPRGGSSTYYDGNYFIAVDHRLYYGDQSFGIHCLEEEQPAKSRPRRREANRR